MRWLIAATVAIGVVVVWATVLAVQGARALVTERDDPNDDGSDATDERLRNLP